MSLSNTRSAYGWAAIALHWISAAGVIVLYLTGDAAGETEVRTAKLAATAQHVSIGMLLFSFLLARLLWSLSQPRPDPLESNRSLRLIAQSVQVLFLAMIAAQIVTGPLVVWADARPLAVFDWVSIPSPFHAKVAWLQEASGEIHELAPKVLWPLLGLHVLGALKHLVLDRDATVRRMLWVRT